MFPSLNISLFQSPRTHIEHVLHDLNNDDLRSKPTDYSYQIPYLYMYKVLLDTL